MCVEQSGRTDRTCITYSRVVVASQHVAVKLFVFDLLRCLLCCAGGCVGSCAQQTPKTVLAQPLGSSRTGDLTAATAQSCLLRDTDVMPHCALTACCPCLRSSARTPNTPILAAPSTTPLSAQCTSSTPRLVAPTLLAPMQQLLQPAQCCSGRLATPPTRQCCSSELSRPLPLQLCLLTRRSECVCGLSHVAKQRSVACHSVWLVTAAGSAAMRSGRVLSTAHMVVDTACACVCVLTLGLLHGFLVLLRCLQLCHFRQPILQDLCLEWLAGARGLGCSPHVQVLYHLLPCG